MRRKRPLQSFVDGPELPFVVLSTAAVQLRASGRLNAKGFMH